MLRRNRNGGVSVVGIRDLARHLDISIGTVSRALNDKTDVNEETRARVRAAATKFGYSPNQSGRSLRRGKTDLVGVIVPVGVSNEPITPIFLSVLDGLRRKLLESRLDIAIFLQGQDEDLVGALRKATERGLVDGVIIANTQRLDPRIDFLLERRRPFVAFGRSLSGGAHPWVDPEFEAATDQAVAQLAERGHRRIGLVLPEGETNYLYLIIDAYRAALERRGVVIDPAYLQRQPAGELGGFRAAEALLTLPAPPTAILVSEALQTIGLYRRLAQEGLTPGRDISVFGLLAEDHALTLAPTLTRMATDWTFVGSQLGEALVSALSPAPQVRGRTQARTPHAIVATHFIEGASVHRVDR
jgi:DNA-binding LacI/PurR family transcriptional regulator